MLQLFSESSGSECSSSTESFFEIAHGEKSSSLMRFAEGLWERDLVIECVACVHLGAEQDVLIT